MAEYTPDLGLPELAEAQALPHVTHNLAIVLLQALLNGAIDKDTSAPPGSPTEGDTYIIDNATPTGAWAGHARAVTIYWAGAWRFIPGDGTAMGARQEGLSIFVRDENVRYVWSGSAWGIDGTDIYVEKAGDTMTGPLVVSLSSTGYGVDVQQSDAGVNGAAMRMFHNSASPAASDIIAALDMAGKDNAAATINYAAVQGRITDVTAGAASGECAIRTRRVGTVADRLTVQTGIYAGSATGGDQGAGTINAVNYFDDGVNINLIYGSLATNNAWTAKQTLDYNDGTREVQSIINDSTGAGVALDGFLWGAVSAGPSYRFTKGRGSKASPGQTVNGDTLGQFIYRGYNDAGTPAVTGNIAALGFKADGNITTTSQPTALFVDVTASASTSRRQVFRIAADGGVFLEGGSSLGSGSLNATAVVKVGVYTVGTLPAAGTVGAGSRAQVSDSNATLTAGIGAVVAGGGSDNVPVTSDGTNWRIG